MLDRLVAPLRDRTTWRDLGYMLLLGPLGIVAGTIVVALWSAAFAALLTPVFAASAPDGSLLDDIGPCGRGARAPSPASRSPRSPPS